MSHSHDNTHDCDHDHSHDHAGGMHVHPVVKNMRVALILNTLFTCIEFAGGIWTNSVAILSDAVHDLGDSVAIVASLLLEKYSHKTRTPSFTYGKRRFSILAAFITSLILLVGSAIILVESIPRFFEKQPVNASGMLWLALLGILFNGLAFLRLRSGGKSSLSQRAVMLHLLEDVLGWVAILLGSAVMYLTEWYWIDPLLSVGIAFYIAYNAVKNIISALSIFLQSVPASFDEKKIVEELSQIPGIVGVHDIHSWTMDGEYNVLSLHLVTKTGLPHEEWPRLRKEALHILQHQQMHHVTIQLETEEEYCSLTNC